jgi:peptidoglycan/LPS O-acetylase OafA/YrhL
MPIVQLVTWLCVTQFGMGLVPTAMTVVLVVVPGTLGASALLHRYVELPAIHWGRRPNRQAPVADRAAC